MVTFKPMTWRVLAGVFIVTMLGAASCTDGTPAAGPGSTAKVTINGRAFNLELALNDETRFRGLSGRTEIKPEGGMLFVFKKAERREFVMRDCPIPIDIIYLDGSGRVTAMHAMVPDPPREDDEKELSPPRDRSGRIIPGLPEWTWTNEKYENRLKRYPSKFPAQFVIELKGGTLETLKLKEGDRVELDREGLKKLAS
ncbi:MAG: DUF192 domain-containing protein [Phycisphaeraceae bacterium]|nr:DUF192 domain-containing protein [Phycisphaeraceae bacterium]